MYIAALTLFNIIQYFLIVTSSTLCYNAVSKLLSIFIQWVL